MLDGKDKVNDKTIINALKSSMALSEEDLNNRLVSLITNQYITLTYVNGCEIYSLDDVYKRLSNVLDQESEIKESKEKDSDLKKAIAFIEREFDTPVRPIDLEVIKHWIEVDKFSFDDIKSATLECLKYKKKNIKYVDAILNKDKINTNKTNTDTDIYELFKAVYGKYKN